MKLEIPEIKKLIKAIEGSDLAKLATKDKKYVTYVRDLYKTLRVLIVSEITNKEHAYYATVRLRELKSEIDCLLLELNRPAKK